MVGWTYYSTFNQPWHNVVNMSLLCRRCEDVVKLTPRFQRCNDVANATFMVFRALNLIPSVQATLQQRCMFEVVASRLCKRCETMPRFERWAMLSIQYASDIVSWDNTPMLPQHLLIVAIWTLWYQRRYNIIYWLCDVTILPKYCLTILFLQERYLLFNTLKSFDSQ